MFRHDYLRLLPIISDLPLCHLRWTWLNFFVFGLTCIVLRVNQFCRSGGGSGLGWCARKEKKMNESTLCNFVHSGDIHRTRNWIEPELEPKSGKLSYVTNNRIMYKLYPYSTKSSELNRAYWNKNRIKLVQWFPSNIAIQCQVQVGLPTELTLSIALALVTSRHVTHVTSELFRNQLDCNSPWLQNIS